MLSRLRNEDMYMAMLSQKGLRVAVWGQEGSISSPSPALPHPGLEKNEISSQEY